MSLDTESSTNNAVVNEKAVENIPLNGRDFTQLVKVVPGYNGAGSIERNAYEPEQLADRRRGQQRHLAERRGGQPGRRTDRSPV